jgi:hypothetical protein
MFLKTPGGMILKNDTPVFEHGRGPDSQDSGKRTINGR